MAAKVPAKRKWGDIATVTLIVGESKTAFQLHEERLFEASSFFKAAFTSKFRESSERTMTLPEDDVGTFEDFAEWLYNRGVRLDILFSPVKTRFTAALKLFVLADKYQVIELKNIVTEHIFTVGRNAGQRAHKYPVNSLSLTKLAYIYAHTVQSSGIRKLFADWYAWHVNLVCFERPDVRAFLEKYPECATDFVVSLAKRLNNKTHKASNPFRANMPEEYKDKESRQEN